MDAPITREELVYFARQMALLAFVAGVLGAMVSSALWSAVGAAFEWLHRRAQARARINAARTRAARGMGQSPMLDLSRPAYPHQWAGGELGRVSQVEAGQSQAHAVGGRVVKHSVDPRPLSVDQASPDSCLKDKRASGAPALRCAHGGGADSGETPSVLEELALPPSGPSLAHG